MIIEPLRLKGACLIKHEYNADSRGGFGRLFCVDTMKDFGLEYKIVQVNHSITKQLGCVRGLHFQKPPKAEVKIVKCIKGAVYDVIVDLRKESPTFMEYTAVELISSKLQMLYIPKGFAHGYQVLEENSELVYFHTEFYSPKNESAIHYLDPLINIPWPLEISEVSLKDQEHKFLNNDFKGIQL